METIHKFHRTRLSVLGGLLILLLLLSAFFLVRIKVHSCTGNDCVICMLLNSCGDQGPAPSGALFILLAIPTVALPLLCPLSDAPPRCTPIRLRDELNI